MRTFGYLVFKFWQMSFRFACRPVASAGNAWLGFDSASFSQHAPTCDAVTPAAVSRVWITLQKLAFGFAMIVAVWPPWAPSTTTRRGFRCTSAFEVGTKVENSWVVFDIPIESSTMRPAGSLCAATDPFARRGTTPPA